MIRGIAKIKCLGVFGDYAKPEGMQEFGVKNLIYGWNYSGKTTLSRLFAQIENKVQNPDLAGCAFTIETDGNVITESNFEQSNLTVRVFNGDFIRENLNFSGQSFNPILLLGKDSGQAQKKLNHCEDLSKRTREKIKAFAKEASDIETAFSADKKAAAARIKRNLGLVDAYTATHLTKDITRTQKLEESQLLSEEKLNDDLKLALTPDSEKLNMVEQITVDPSIESLHKEAISVLATTPDLSDTIKYLEENPLIEKWVATGLELHSEKEKCEFCGGDLSNHRLNELEAHFSKDLAVHKDNVEKLYNQVKAAKLLVQLPKEAELNPQFRERFRTAAASLPKAIKDFNKAVDTLATDLQKKIDAPFRAQKPTPLPEGIDQAITDVVRSINEVIDDNNRIAFNFTQAKQDAINRVKLHFVQEFIDEQEKLGRNYKLNRLKAKQEKLNRFDALVQQEAEKLRAVISQAQLGREEINERLVALLGSDAVQIKVVNDNEQERFQLVRKNGSLAVNLSAGEKTAIAFAYFLTKLKELKPEQFKETIVYIDDPISSLDANHIFQVTAAIKDLFFCQKQKNGNLTWTTTCKQIFISTHNFEFFHLLREIKPIDKKQARLYLIKRLDPQKSTLENMPDTLSKYASEYHFLFEIIYKFHNASDKTNYEVLMLLPNAVRRFVELYTYSRLPGGFKETVDQRAETLFGEEKAKRVLKVFHYFSHANNIERLAGKNELIFDVEYAVTDLLSTIKDNDPLHWEALIQSVDD